MSEVHQTTSKVKRIIRICIPNVEETLSISKNNNTIFVKSLQLQFTCQFVLTTHINAVIGNFTNL